MMPTKPVTAFKRYRTPAIRAVFLVEFIPALLCSRNSRVRSAPLCHVRGRHNFRDTSSQLSRTGVLAQNPCRGILSEMGMFRQLTDQSLRGVVCWELLSVTRLSDCIALCVPAHGQISQFSERGIAIDGVVKAD